MLLADAACHDGDEGQDSILGLATDAQGPASRTISATSLLPLAENMAKS